MKLEPFLMERMQSTWENLVEYNLSESGVHPMSLKELIQDDSSFYDALVNQELGYSQSNGTIELREKIAALYPQATVDHVQVTTGTSEANFLCIWSLVQPGDEVVMMLPNYMQIWGIARGFGGVVRPFHLREEEDWKPNLDELRKAVSSKTKLIAVCNPNNPTGAILDPEEMNKIVEVARSVNAWLLADEVYLGAERDRDRTPSFWNRYEKTIITSGLSKAYGLPGLRIGWIIAPTALISTFWSYHDYTTIGPSILNDLIARRALIPETRERIFTRTRKIIQNNYPILADWIASHGKTFSMTEPHAGAIAYLKYKIQINSTILVEKLLHEKSVLIVPGDHFGMDRFLRIGYGPPPDYLRSALDRIHDTLQELEKD
jgi:aspartate/methionine/tyrosine aminotransferase